jgi:uncharacterized membrane protein SpoIIM required for sporulation
MMFEQFKILNMQILIFSVLLFFIGYAFAPTAYFKRIKWITAYPFFIIKLMDRYFKKDWHPLKIFCVIFFLNSFSLFVNLLSGWVAVLPCIFIIYLGMNIGVIMYHTLEGRYYYMSLLNPVSLLELPAAWISITMAIQFSLSKYFDVSFIDRISFLNYVLLFLKTVIPLLFLAGVIETALIVIGRNKDIN